MIRLVKHSLMHLMNHSVTYLMNHQKGAFLALYFQNLGKVKKKINQTTNHDHLLKIPTELKTKRLWFLKPSLFMRP